MLSVRNKGGELTCRETPGFDVYKSADLGNWDVPF